MKLNIYETEYLRNWIFMKLDIYEAYIYESEYLCINIFSRICTLNYCQHTTFLTQQSSWIFLVKKLLQIFKKVSLFLRVIYHIFITYFIDIIINTIKITPSDLSTISPSILSSNYHQFTINLPSIYHRFTIVLPSISASIWASTLRH